MPDPDGEDWLHMYEQMAKIRAFEEQVNELYQAAKIHYMSGGKLKVPMVLRTTMGAGRRSAAQHSQSLHAWLSHIPGLNVVVPSTPYDAKGLMKSAIRDNNPVAVLEDKMLYKLIKGPVPEAEYTIPLGVADFKREGSDMTLVATSSMVYTGLEAAKQPAEIGLSAEVVDPRCCRWTCRRSLNRPRRPATPSWWTRAKSNTGSRPNWLRSSPTARSITWTRRSSASAP